MIMHFMQKMKLIKILAETRNISATASKLNLSQSTISHHLKNLEVELGFPLFNRVGKASMINREGERFLVFAETALREYERTLEDIKDSNGDFDLSLTVYAGDCFHAYYFPKILPLFRAMRPEVQPEMLTKYSDQIIAEMEDDQHEFAIVATSHQLRSPRLITDFLFDIPLYFVCSPGNPLVQKEMITPTDLRDETFIFTTRGTNYRDYLDQEFLKHRYRLTSEMTIDSFGAIKATVISNLGISILPQYVVQGELDRGELTRVPIAGLRLRRKLICIHHVDRYLSNNAKAFIDVAAKIMSEQEEIIIQENDNGTTR